MTRPFVLSGILTVGTLASLLTAGTTSAAPSPLHGLSGRVATVATHSATWRHNGLTRSLDTRTVKLLASRGTLRRFSRVAAPAHLTATDLELPASVFTGVTVSKSETVTAATSPFAPLHSQNYAGMLGAYYQEVDVPAADGSSALALGYQGSYYTDNNAALASFNDVAGPLQKADPNAKNCASDIQGNPCVLAAYSVTDPTLGTLDGLYTGAQVGQCTVEVLMAAPDAVAQANTDSIVKATATLFADGVQNALNVCGATSPTTTGSGTGTGTGTGTTTPTPAATTLMAVEVQPNGAQDTTVSVTHAKHGAKVQLVAVLENVQQGIPYSAAFTVARGSTVVSKGSFTGTFQHTGTVGLVVTYKLPKKTGTLTISAQVTVAGQTMQKSTTFKVTKH